MRNQVMGALGGWMMAAVPLFAQTPPATPAPEVLQAPPPGSVVQQIPPPPLDYPLMAEPRVGPAEPFHIWTRFEFMAWWVKQAPLPVPIALAADANGNLQTAIGGSNTDFGALGGGRLALGAWFDQHNNYGFESGFFFLERRSNRQGLFADGNGNPAISLSYLSATPGQSGEFVLPLAVPGTFDGGVLVTQTLQAWGAEVNGTICWLRTGRLEFTTLAGFRYLDLQENTYIDSTSTNLATGDFIVLSDRFATRNQFYGGQVGARVNWQLGRLSMDATGKLGLGTTHQAVEIQGTSFTSTSDLLPGGFFAQPSNIGRHSANAFSVVPSLELKLNYQLSPWWRLFFGYDFIYWNQVVRPGNQIDRNINLTQSQILGAGALTGPASPMPLFNRSDFSAQGLTFGLEFRF